MWCYLPKTLVSRGVASRRRCFEVTCPPVNVDLTSLYLPKTLVLHVRGFSPRKRLSFRGPTSRKGWFHVILHPEKVFGARCFSSRGPWFDVGWPHETLILRHVTSRRRWFYVVLTPRKRWSDVLLPPENVYFTLCHLPKTLILRCFGCQKRWFYVMLPPEDVYFYVGWPPKNGRSTRL